MDARRRYHEAMFMACPTRNCLHSTLPERPPVPSDCRHGAGSQWNTCQFWQGNPSMWGTDFVQVGQTDDLDHDQYRYQIYAKPTKYNCQPNVRGSMSSSLADQQQAHARSGCLPPTTDVRALYQSMYIPVVPSNPAGETEYTFPMTLDTLGQPDVTSACCVPVVPTQPGYQNLTPGILPGPCPQLDGYLQSTGGQNRCGYTPPHQQPWAGQGQRLGNICPCPRLSQSDHYQGYPCPPHTVAPPSNVPGSGYLGLPDTFPMAEQRVGCDLTQRPCMLQPPHYDGTLGKQCDNPLGETNPQKQCIDVSSVRHTDIARRRTIKAVYETPQQRYQRLTSMYGAFGSYLIGRPRPKRFLSGQGACLKDQGNGFQWDYPKNHNDLCYVLEKHSRC